MFYKGKHKQRFSIRKYSFGAASVLLGAVIVGAAAPAVNADETQSNALPSVQVESQNTDSATVAVENEAEQATVATKDAGESMESSDQLANDETAVETPTTSASEVAEKSSEAVADESEVSSDKVENTTSEVSDSTVSSTVSGSSSALSESTEKERQIVTTTLENFTALPAKVKAQYQARLSSALTPTEIEGILAEARKQNTLRQVTFGNQGQPIPTGTSLRANTTTGATVVDDNANSNSVTLTHGDNSTRNVNISIPTIIGDKVTVEVPYIFSASTDRDLTGGIYDVSISSASASPEYVTSKSGSTQTFEYTVNTTASVEFNVKLVPTVADWSFLKPGAQYHVVVKRNGIEVGGVDYTIAQQPATVEKVNINFDQNQSANGNLVKGHKYAVGINLQNNGINDGDNFAGTVVVNVPAGFKLDTDSNSGFGFVSTTPTGDTTAGFNTLSNGTNLTVTQEGGAGTPVTITFNKSKTDLNTGNLIFWGTYENNLSGADNNFSATVTYYSTNTDGERSKEADLVATGNLAVGLPVSATEKSALELSFKANTGNIYTDNGTADGTHQSDDLTYEYGDTRKLQVYNSGNVTQTNVKVHVDVEPGTVLGGGEGQYNLSFTTSSENVLGAVSVTLTDGTVVNLRTSSTLGPHNVNNTFLLIGDSAIAKGVAKDGSNIKSIDFTYAEIQAGSKVELVFSKNAILSSVKNTATADYSYTVTSDQGANETGSMSLPIVDPNAKQVQFTGVIEDFAKTSYQPTSTDGGNLAQITYNFRNSINGTTSTTPTSYFVSVPRGFDLVDVNDLALYQYGKAYTDGTIEDLGYIGVNGERMLKVSLPTTPSYQAPIYLKSAKGHDTPVQLIANEDQLPANYIYRGSAFNTPKDMSLIMAINDDKIYTSNYAWDMREITLKDGSTHNVVLSTRGWYPNSEEANYSFTYPSAYGQLNGIKTEDDGKYSLAYNVAKPTDNIVSNNYSDNNNVTDTTGTIRLVNILTDRSTSAYSYNVINLPNVADGDAVTITVTGAGTVETTGDSGNGTLLFSTSKLDNTDGEISASDIANYVTADQVTDWSAIKSILLKSDQLVPSASAAGMVPYKVTAMADGVTNTTLDLQSYFTGDHSGVVYNTSQINKLNIQRYVDVTTNWVDGEGKPLKASTTVTVKSGDAYSTSGLTPTEIPAGYHLKENPVNAVGTTDSSNVVVTYVYEPDVTTKAVTKTVTQIVTYQGAGTATPADHVETVTFTGVETLNTVTGESTTQWNESSATFADVKTPVVTGYVADIATVTGETVTPESGDVTKVVTYKTVGKLIPIDETGVPIPNVPTPSYDNDPNDPTKVIIPNVPEIPGYVTPSKPGEPTDPTQDTPIVYVKAEQKATIAYIDDTTGATLKTDTASGKSGEVSSYRTADSITAYLNQGYELVSDNYPSTGVTFDDDVTVDQTFEVHLKQGEVTVTPNNPGKPGDPIDPNNPDGPKYPAGTAESDVKKDVKETVTYVGAGDQTPASVVQTATWTREITFNKVTGAITKTTEWIADKDSYDEVKTPVVTGYVADKASVASTAVTQEDIEAVVTYKTVGKLIPIDETGVPIPNVPTPSYDNDPNDPTKVIIPNVPEIPGYVTPSKPGEPTDPTQDTPIVYVKAEQKATIAYIDDTTGATLKTDTASGKSGEVSSYRTADSITAYLNQGYELVSDNYPSTGVTFDDDVTVDQTFEVHLKQGEVTVTPNNPGKPGDPIDPNNPDGPKYPAGTAESDVKKDVKETVTYVGAGDQTPASVVQTATWTREITFNKVTGAITKTTEWIADKDSYDEVKTPVVTGYVADKASVASTAVTQEDIEAVVTYKTVGKLIPIDETGVPIPNVPTPSYDNDPNDPTKVIIPNVPEIPGYVTPSKPGEPTDPTQDTPIVYVKVPSQPEQPKTETTVTVPDKSVTEVASQPKQAAATLPETGDSVSGSLSLAGTVLSLLGIGVAAGKRRKDED